MKSRKPSAAQLDTSGAANPIGGIATGASAWLIPPVIVPALLGLAVVASALFRA